MSLAARQYTRDRRPPGALRPGRRDGEVCANVGKCPVRRPPVPRSACGAYGGAPGGAERRSMRDYTLFWRQTGVGPSCQELPAFPCALAQGARQPGTHQLQAFTGRLKVNPLERLNLKGHHIER